MSENFFEGFLDVLEDVVNGVQKNSGNKTNLQGTDRTMQNIQRTHEYTANNKIMGLPPTIPKAKKKEKKKANKSGAAKKNKRTPERKEPAETLSTQNQSNDILPDLLNLSNEDIIKGIVLSEILGKPKSLKKRHW